MFPAFLDLTGRLAVVIGGGSVGLRKAKALRQAGAMVRVVCLEARPADQTDPGVEWCAEAYESRGLAGAALVFAAATPEVNARVVADARARGVWVSSASDPGAGDFVSPAVVRRGGLVLAVGTGGAAPALARRIRERLQVDFDEAYGQWVALLAEVRPVILAARLDDRERRAVFEELTEERWLESLRREGVEATRQAMRACLARRGIGDTL